MLFDTDRPPTLAALTALLDGTYATVFGLPVGSYFTPQFASLGTTTQTLDNLFMTPLFVPFAMSVDRIGVEITTGVALGSPRLIIYSVTSPNLTPSAVLLDAGIVDASTVGVKEITINQALTPGWVLLGLHMEGANGVGFRYAAGGARPTYSTFVANVLNTTGSSALQSSGAGAVAPAPPLTLTGDTRFAPLIALRRSA